MRELNREELISGLNSSCIVVIVIDCDYLGYETTSAVLSSVIGPTGLTALGTRYRLLLQAFRSLLFLTPTDMSTFPGLGSTVPYSTQLLISRCCRPRPPASAGR